MVSSTRNNPSSRRRVSPGLLGFLLVAATLSPLVVPALAYDGGGALQEPADPTSTPRFNRALPTGTATALVRLIIPFTPAQPLPLPSETELNRIGYDQILLNDIDPDLIPGPDTSAVQNVFFCETGRAHEGDSARVPACQPLGPQTLPAGANPLYQVTSPGAGDLLIQIATRHLSAVQVELRVQETCAAALVNPAISVQLGNPQWAGSQTTAASAVSLAVVDGPESTITNVSPLITNGATPGDPVDLSVLVRNACNVPVKDVPVAWAATAGGGRVLPPVSQTNAAGVATATLTTGSTPGANTVDARAPTVDLAPVTFTVNTVALVVSAAQSTMTPAAQSVSTDGVATATVTVTLKTSSNTPVPGRTVHCSSNRPSDTVADPGTPTDAAGQATCRIRSTVAGTSTISATGDGVALTPTASVTFDAGAVSPLRSTVTASPATVTANGVATATVTVCLNDSTGDGLNPNPVPNKPVTLTSTRGASDTITPPANSGANGCTTGTVKSNAPGTSVIVATGDGLPILQTATVEFIPGAVAAGPSTVTANPTPVSTDGAATSTITVTCRDATGNPVPGKTVVLSSSRPADTVVQPAAPTDPNGVAVGAVRSTTAGTSTISATCDGVALTQTASVTFDPGAVSPLASTAVASPATVAADGVAASTVTVCLRDTNLNALPGKAVTLTSVRGAQDAVTQPTTPTAANGCTAGSVSSSTPGPTRIVAIGDGVPVLQVAAVEFLVGVVSASQSTVTPAAQTVSTDGVATATITVTLKDASGHGIPGKTVALTSSRGASDTIVQPAAATDLNGVAVGAVRSTVAGTSTITATDTTDGIVVTQTASILFDPGTVSPLRSTLGASPASVTANNIATSTITVCLKDTNQNPVAGKAVTLTSTRSQDALTQPANTAADGCTTGTVKSSAPGASVIVATGDGLPILQTATVEFVPGAVAAGTSTVTANPTTVSTDGVATSTITVTCRDATGNPVPGKPVVLFSSRPAADTVVQPATATDPNGVAVGAVRSTVAGTSTISATCDGVAITDTDQVTFDPGAVSPLQSTVSASPSTVAADGTSTSTVTVCLKDANLNPVPAKAVALFSVRAVLDTISPPPNTGANGCSAGTVKSTAAGDTVLVATGDQRPLLQTARVTFTEMPVLTVVATDDHATEGSLDTGTFTVTRAAPSVTRSITVAYSVAGTAANGVDYVFLSGTVAIPAGQTTATITVVPLEDPSPEGTESVQVTLTASSDYTVGTPGSASLDLHDNEGGGSAPPSGPPTVTLTASAPTASEWGPSEGTFTVTRATNDTSGSLSVTYALSGTATQGFDYTLAPACCTVEIPEGALSAPLTVTPVADAEEEPDEQVHVALTAEASYRIGSPSEADGTILDYTTSLVTVNATDPAASEAGDPGNFRLSRLGDSAHALSVSLRVGGTATGGADYVALPSTVILPAGKASLDLPLQPLDDGTHEGTETILLEVLESSGYRRGSAAQSQATVTLSDDDQAPVVYLSTPDAEASEAGQDPGLVRIIRTGPVSAESLTVGLAISGTATAGTDYEALSAQVTFDRGQASLDLVITPIDDRLNEPTETIQVALAPGAAYVVGTASGVTVRLLDDDPSGVTNFLVPDVAAQRLADQSIEVSWDYQLPPTPASAKIGGWLVWRSTSPFVLIGTINDPAAAQFIDATVPPGSEPRYAVSFYLESGEGHVNTIQAVGGFEEESRVPGSERIARLEASPETGGSVVPTWGIVLAAVLLVGALVAVAWYVLERRSQASKTPA